VVATENRGIEELASTVEKFRKHFESSGQRRRKHIEHWQNRLIELLESRLLEKVLGGKEGEARLRALAVEVAERKKDPFSAVSEILKGAKLT
jgi:LAO/AO transport system kinase